ncbi:tyrosine-type recombinase/integrase [Eubacteriales bacterium DFI.9.88]|uniref:tyrosine-type recombinase/integrase n=1 Tax=Hominibacterium faecale TaxID=2839743 RepID=UPI0022B2A842|nr:tyrosine-type recombinase/integrase [Eubacteriales bacterium DFI.9.88]
MSTDRSIFSITDEPVSYYAVSDLYRKYCNKMSIEVKSSHKSRKTVISSMIDANMNINTIREMAGHADGRTAYNNYCFDRSAEDERIEQMERALA